MKMFDKDNYDLKVGDFVQLTKGKKPNINRCLRKGNVYKIHSFRNVGTVNDPLIVCYLTGKKGGHYCYNTVFESSEIKKVDYDFEKRKVIYFE